MGRNVGVLAFRNVLHLEQISVSVGQQILRPRVFEAQFTTLQKNPKN